MKNRQIKKNVLNGHFVYTEVPKISDVSPKKVESREFSYNNPGINMITGFGKF